VSTPSRELHAQALADYMPNGRLFEAKNIQDSNFRQLLRGIAFELFTAQGYITTLEAEYFPGAGTLFLQEWEQALAIPDGCFPGTGTQTERLRDVLVKLSSLGLQTVLDFEALGVTYGLPITVTPLADDPVLAASLGFSPVESRYLAVVEGDDLASFVPPYDVPFSLDIGEVILTCLLEKQKQADTQFIFRSA